MDTRARSGCLRSSSTVERDFSRDRATFSRSANSSNSSYVESTFADFIAFFSGAWSSL